MRKKGFFRGALCGALAMLIVVMIFDVLFNGNQSVLTNSTEKKLSTIYRLINTDFLYTDEMSEEILNEAAIKGYVEGLGDPYSVYYDAEETKSLMESTSGEFGGIGVGLTQNIDTMIISFTNVYEDSPGERAGFKEGDILYKVNGEEVTGQDLDQVVSKIRGEKGTEVEITVLRGEQMEEYIGTAIRDMIEVTTVSSELLEDSIGYIAVSGFEKVTYHQFEAAIEELKTQGMSGLIVDLRNNPGGNLSTVCEMTDLILPKGITVYTEDKNGKKQMEMSDEEHQLDLPLVVLVNGNSASASEIFAGAVQDYGAGKIVGTTTYGKGIVQQIYSLSDGTALKITTSEYFTPNGRNIHGKGIVPDVVVEYEYDEANPEADNQLQAAIDILK